MKIVVDIWGGESSMDHVARFIQPVDVALRTSEVELSKGFLVNLRADKSFGPQEDFDSRIVTSNLTVN